MPELLYYTCRDYGTATKWMVVKRSPTGDRCMAYGLSFKFACRVVKLLNDA